jgi:hypothetical protein
MKIDDDIKLCEAALIFMKAIPEAEAAAMFHNALDRVLAYAREHRMAENRADVQAGLSRIFTN